MEKNLIDSWGIFEKDVFSNNFNTLKNLFHNKETSTFLELLDKVLEGTEDVDEKS